MSTLRDIERIVHRTEVSTNNGFWLKQPNIFLGRRYIYYMYVCTCQHRHTLKLELSFHIFKHFLFSLLLHLTCSKTLILAACNDIQILTVCNWFWGCWCCRWAMFGFAVGMLTEYATGSDFVDQVKIMLSNFGIIDLEWLFFLYTTMLLLVILYDFCKLYPMFCLQLVEQVVCHSCCFTNQL